MPESKEISFKERRQRIEFDKLKKNQDPENLFDIPMGEIDQFMDGANDSKSDPIVLHPKAVVAVKRLLSRFGIEGLPQTVGEFRGALYYCKILHNQVNYVRMSDADNVLWEKATLNSLEDILPEIVAPYLALKAGNMDELRRINREVMTFPVLSSHHHPEHGWLSRGKEKPDT